MHIIYRILLLTTFCGVFIHCQGGGGGHGGGGGGGGGGGFGGSGYHGGSGSSCTTDDCRRRGGIIAGSIIGGIIGLLLAIFGTLFCCKRCQGRPSRKNPSFVNGINVQNQKQEAYNTNPFQSGLWSSRYFQYGTWHGPCRFSLSFDNSSTRVTGFGADDVGTFTIDGVYATKTNRIGLTKTYQLGTGNPSENLGHQVTTQLIWNAQNNQFEGKWYVQTNKYRGEDKFELKFEGQDQPPAYKKI